MMTTRHHLELLPLNMDMPTRWKSNAISNAATGRTKANQRHRFNRPRRPWQANATSHSASEGFAIRWREHVRTSTIYQAHDPLPPRHDPLIPSSCDIRFLDTTHERKKMTDRQRTCLSLRIGSTPVRYLLLMHVFEPSGNPACSGIHIRKHPPESCTRTEPRQYVSVGPNQALATTFWSPVILNDIGHCPSCRVREARIRCPFDERKVPGIARRQPWTITSTPPLWL